VTVAPRGALARGAAVSRANVTEAVIASTIVTPMTSTLRRAVGVLGVGLALVAGVASGETEYPTCAEEPTAEAVEAAQGAFKAGKAAFDEGDFDRAITYWIDAYRRDCRAHDLLQNLARAYELKGDRAEAVHALETLLQRKPDTPHREQFERRIESHRAQMAAEAAAASSAAPPPSATTEAAATGPASAPPPAVEHTARRKPVAPLVVAAAGGVVAVVGGVLWFGAHEEVSDFEAECGDDRQHCPGDVKADANAARSREQLSGGVAIGGLAVAAGGALWYLLAPAKPVRKGAGTVVSPLVGEGLVGATVSARF